MLTPVEARVTAEVLLIRHHAWPLGLPDRFWWEDREDGVHVFFRAPGDYSDRWLWREGMAVRFERLPVGGRRYTVWFEGRMLQRGGRSGLR